MIYRLFWLGLCLGFCITLGTALPVAAKTDRQIQQTLQEKINIQGAPFKGPADASVAVVVFSDFQ